MNDANDHSEVNDDRPNSDDPEYFLSDTFVCLPFTTCLLGSADILSTVYVIIF